MEVTTITMKNNLIHKSYVWRCDEDGCKVKFSDMTSYNRINLAIEIHNSATGHHKGILTVREMIETWK